MLTEGGSAPAAKLARLRYGESMEHDEFIEEYLSICAAMFECLQRTGQLDEVLNRQERTRTQSSLENKDIPVGPFSPQPSSNPTC
jgi:hypothetical protein